MFCNDTLQIIESNIPGLLRNLLGCRWSKRHCSDLKKLLYSWSYSHWKFYNSAWLL